MIIAIIPYLQQTELIENKSQMLLDKEVEIDYGISISCRLQTKRRSSDIFVIFFLSRRVNRLRITIKYNFYKLLRWYGRGDNF